MQIIMREISPIKQNILKYLDSIGVSKYEFYQKTGISNGILSQKNGLSEDNILRLLSYYTDINPEWLITGKGSMLRKGDTVAIQSPSGIPLVSVKTIGGFGNQSFAINSQDIKDYYVIPKFKNKRIDFMIEVEGSSMYPKYSSGDIVACTIISENTWIQWNKTHVVATREQGIIIKRIKKGSMDHTLLMVSDNSSYDPFEIPKEEITGMALVVGVIRLE